MFSLNRNSHNLYGDFTSAQLFDQDTFYRQFIRNIQSAREEVVIESPFITSRRMRELLPIFKSLKTRGVNIVINTRHPEEHEELYRLQAEEAVESMFDLGISVLFTGGIHRKLAIIDRQTVWHGSLNILSFNDSCEIMTRVESATFARKMILFTKLDKHLGRLQHERY